MRSFSIITYFRPKIRMNDTYIKQISKIYVNLIQLNHRLLIEINTFITVFKTCIIKPTYDRFYE